MEQLALQFFTEKEIRCNKCRYFKAVSEKDGNPTNCLKKYNLCMYKTRRNSPNKFRGMFGYYYHDFEYNGWVR